MVRIGGYGNKLNGARLGGRFGAGLFTFLNFPRAQVTTRATEFAVIRCVVVQAVQPLRLHTGTVRSSSCKNSSVRVYSILHQEGVNPPQPRLTTPTVV